MATILGWLTLASLVLTVLLAINKPVITESSPITIDAFYLAGVWFLIMGIAWSHTRGQKGLKATFLGFVGFVGGGLLGLLLGEAGDAILPSGERYLGIAILLVVGCFWIGAILFATLGVWWVIRFHRRFGPGAC